MQNFYVPKINYIDLGQIYSTLGQIENSRVSNRLNQMKMAEAEKAIAKDLERNDLAKAYLTPATPGSVAAGAPGADTFNAYKRSSAPPMLDSVRTEGDTTFINQGPMRTGTPTGFGYQPGSPASFDTQGYKNALYGAGDAEGAMAVEEQVQKKQALQQKEVESRMAFYKPAMDAAIKEGNNDALQQIVGNIKKDPVLGRIMPKDFAVSVAPTGETQTVLDVKEGMKGPDGQPILDPYTKQPLAPGKYKITARGQQVLKVEPVSPYGEDGVTEPALAIRAARGDKEAQAALDHLAKKRATNEQQVDFRNEAAMRKEFLSLPEVKEYPVIEQQSQRALKALSDNSGNNVAVDQSVITTFNKMLDPSSVVRESEYARTPQDMALLNRIKGKWEKITTGGAGLTDDERQAMYRMITAFKEVADAQYNEQVDYYSGLAKRYKYSPENVVRLGGRRAGGEATAQPQTQNASTPMKSMPDPRQNKGRIVKDTETGVRYQSDGATWRTIK